MASVLCDESLWRGHANTVRALCDLVSDPEEKVHISAVADGFDLIAELAKEHAALHEQYALTD